MRLLVAAKPYRVKSPHRHSGGERLADARTAD